LTTRQSSLFLHPTLLIALLRLSIYSSTASVKNKSAIDFQRCWNLVESARTFYDFPQVSSKFSSQAYISQLRFLSTLFSFHLTSNTSLSRSLSHFTHHTSRTSHSNRQCSTSQLPSTTLTLLFRPLPTIPRPHFLQQTPSFLPPMHHTMKNALESNKPSSLASNKNVDKLKPLLSSPSNVKSNVKQHLKKHSGRRGKGGNTNEL